MAFADRIDRKDLALLFYVRISGLPYVWATGPNPWGGSTVAIDDPAGNPETYTWLQGLAPGEAWATVEQRIDPWAGIGEVGTLSIPLLLPGTQSQQAAKADPLLSLITASVFRTAGGASSTFLTADLTVTGASASVASVAGWPATGTIYVGPETMTYGALGAASFDNLTRGRYWSQAMHFVGDPTNVAEMGATGPFVCPMPLTLKNRCARVWAVTGRMVGETFVPYGAAPESNEDREIWAGIVTGTDVADDYSKVTVRTQDLTRLLGDKILSRCPRASAGLPNGYIYVGPDNWYVAWIWRWRAKITGATFTGSDDDLDVHFTRLLYAVGGVPTVVPEGIYSIAQVSEYVAYTMEQNPGTIVTKTIFTGGAWPTYSLAHVEGDSGEVRIQFTATVDGTASVPVVLDLPYRYFVFPSGGGVTIASKTTIWEDLGLTATLRMEPDTTTWAGATAYQCELQEGIRCYRPPANNTRDSEKRTRLYYFDPNAVPFAPNIFVQDDGATNVPGYALVETEAPHLMPFTAGPTTVTTDGLGQPLGFTVYYLTLATWSSAGEGSELDHQAVYNTKTIANPAMRQILGFDNCRVDRIARYLLASGSGVPGTYSAAFDVGWRGMGIGVDLSLYVDETSWLMVGQRTDSIRSVRFVDPTEVREWLAVEMVVLGAYVASKTGWDGTRHKLGAAILAQPSEADYLTAWPLDTSAIVEGAHPKCELDESRIVNVVVGRNLVYDWASQEGRHTVTWRHANSIGTFGEADPLEVDMHWCTSPSVAPHEVGGVVIISPETVTSVEDRFVRLCERMASHWIVPHLRLEIPCSRAWAWQAEVGDLAIITHPGVPSVTGDGWGVTGLLARIYAVAHTYYRGKARSVITAICQRGDYRYSEWAPAAYADVVGGAGTQLDTITSYYSTGGTLADALLFEAGDLVRVSRPGDDATSATHSVVSVTLVGAVWRITINPATALAAPVIIEPAEYTGALADGQRRRAFMSDGDRILNKAAGSDDCFWYQ